MKANDLTGVLPFEPTQLRELITIYHNQNLTLNKAYNDLLAITVLAAIQNGGSIEVPIAEVEKMNEGISYEIQAITDDERGVMIITAEEKSENGIHQPDDG